MSDLLRAISDAITAAREPVSEDLVRRLRDNAFLNLGSILNDSTELLAGAVDSVLVGVITDADPTSGVIERDDQFNGHYLRFTSGGAFTTNNLNKFKIISVSKTLNTVSVAEDLAAAGVSAADTYVILGHTHDGSGTDPNGTRIDLKDLANSAEDSLMTQDLADAITDPDSVRSTAADKAAPFVNQGDLERLALHDYTQAGRAFTVTQSGAGSNSSSHNLVLPISSIDYLIFGSFKAEARVQNDTEVAFTELQINAVAKPKYNVQVECILDDAKNDNSNGGAFVALGRNGQAVFLNAEVTNGGFAEVSISIEAFQEIIT